MRKDFLLYLIAKRPSLKIKIKSYVDYHALKARQALALVDLLKILLSSYRKIKDILPQKWAEELL